MKFFVEKPRPIPNKNSFPHPFTLSAPSRLPSDCWISTAIKLEKYDYKITINLIVSL